MSHTFLSDPMLGRLAKAQSLRAVLDVGLADAIALTGAEMGNVQMLAPCGDLVIVAHTNTSAAFLRRFAHMPSDDATVCARAARDGGVVHVADLAAHPDWASLAEFARTIPFTSVISSALVSRGALIGVLSVHSRHPLTPSRLELAALRDYSSALADRLARMSADPSVTAYELARQVLPELACGCN